MTKPAELRALSMEDLQERLEEAQAELFNLRSQQATVQNGKSCSIRHPV